MRKFLLMLLVGLLLVPSSVLATPTIEELQKQIAEIAEQLDELEGRVGKTEIHTATDRISWYGDMRVKADSTRQKVMIRQAMVTTAGVVVNPFGSNTDFTEDNAILYTTRLRLGMKAKVAKNIKFNGRLLMYKNWGDSAGVKVMDGWGAFTMDGTNSGNTTDDTIRVDRAYFVWSDLVDGNAYLSIGRRPSTYGAPTNYRENETRGGTPSGHLVNFDFDGITIGYKLGNLTDTEGQTIRFCYGQGYESEYGNGTLGRQTEVEDTHLGGFNFDVWDDGDSWLQLTLFGAKDVTDGFKGVGVMPMIDSDGDGIGDSMNTNGFITRLSATTNVGDMLLGGIGYGRELENGMILFGSLGWTRTIANNNVNAMGFGGLLSDAAPIFDGTGAFTGTYATDGVGEDRDGYSIYIGTQIPAPMGKIGLEYNYGSQYWAPFSQAQDDVVGSKLATRGHAGEAYYIFDINRRTHIKIGAIYYDYEYTGSGSMLGKPQKISDVEDGKAFSAFPVIDTALDAYASMTIKF